MIKLVAIETVESGISYSRYDGKEKTHNGVTPTPLTMEDVENFRKNPEIYSGS